VIPVLIAALGDYKARRYNTQGKHRATNPDADFPRFEQPSEADMERRPEQMSPDSATTTASEGPQNDAPAVQDLGASRRGATQGSAS
jgi:hypothetical protein